MSSQIESRGFKLELGKCIGKGSFSKVYSASYHQSGKTTVLACKVIRKSEATEVFLNKFLPREIEILPKINHADIVGIHSLFTSSSHVWIFMRLCENGNLLDFISKTGVLPENRGKLWFSQMAAAVDYLHNDLSVAHRDLKCENILITSNMNCKLSDFGFSRCVPKNGFKSQTNCGSEGEKLSQLFVNLFLIAGLLLKVTLHQNSSTTATIR